MTTNRNERKNFAWIFWFILFILKKTNAADNRVESLASVLREVTGQLERFNSLYMNKFERELSTTSSRISSMEATLRAVADRAHAWDNIQNHMAVWTDQSRTMERKLDILNRCHEKQAAWESKLSAIDALNHKLTALDNKINAMTRLEFKVEKVSERVEEIDSKINYLRERSNAIPYGEQPGLAHLAKRGLVSYLSTLDTKLDNITKKIDKLSHNHHHNINNHPTPRIFGARTRGSLTLSEPRMSERKEKPKEITECFMSPQDSQMMEDVSAKVDLLFDRLTDPDYDYNSFVGNFKRQAPSADAPPPSASLHSDFDSTPEHVFAKFWKSLFSPFKKMNKKFKSFEIQLTDIQRTCNGTFSATSLDESPSSNALGKVLDDRMVAFEDTLREEMAETKVAIRDQSSHLEKIAQMLSNSVYANEKLKGEVTQQFEQHRVVLQSRFHEIWNLIRQNCGRDPDRNNTPRAPAPTLPVVTTAMSATTAVTPTATVVSIFPTFSSGNPSLKANRPAHARAINYAARCLPKDSPVWKMPNVDKSIKVCPIGTEEHQRFDYRVQYSPGASNNAASKRTYRKSKNSIVRTYGRKKLAKRSLSPNSADQIIEESDFHSLPWKDCSELLEEGYDESKVYMLGVDRDYNVVDRDYYTRYCDHDSDGGGWTVVQRRGMFGNPHLNFTRNWDDYKNGFGRLEREFWWGNDFLHRLSFEQPMTIRFDLWDFDDNYAFAEYSHFKVESEVNKYRLSVSGYRGNASDSFSAHNGFYFSTFDRDNDEAPECCPCAPAYGGGWWFFSCFESNLNGVYHSSPNDNDYYRGLIWELWLGDYSLKATEIKVRPSNFSDSSYPTPFPDPYPTDDLNPELP